MAIELGILFAIGAMIFWGFGDFYIQRTTRKLGDFEALFFIGLFGSIVLFPFVFGELKYVFSNYNLLLALGLLGFTTLIVSIINFQALKEGKLAIIDPILELELPVTMLFAIIFLQEKLTVPQFFLAALIFAGILLISFSKRKFKSGEVFEKGAALAIVTAIGMGFNNFFTGHLARQSSPLLAIWSAWTVFAIICFMYLMYKKGPKQIIKDAKKQKKNNTGRKFL